jgi:hypothetical protein
MQAFHNHSQQHGQVIVSLKLTFSSPILFFLF